MTAGGHVKLFICKTWDSEFVFYNNYTVTAQFECLDESIPGFLKKYSKISIEEISNVSTNETLSRTLITSVTTLLALFSIFIFGGAILKGFSFAMILGVIIGTYSSIYIANPVLIRLNVSQKTILKEDKE